MKPRNRDRVIVIGNLRAYSSFRNCGLTPVSFGRVRIADEYGRARAIVISERQGKFRKVASHFQRLIPKAEAHGVSVYVLAQSPEDHQQYLAIRKSTSKELGYDLIADCRFRTELDVIAREIAFSYCSPVAGHGIDIRSPDFALSEDQRTLLGRAFHDCSQIRVEPLVGGTVAPDVFRVHASVTSGPTQRPLPFFVKFLVRSEYDKEWNNYHQHVDSYVPFNLCPNLVRSRCARGNPLCVLVGSMVEDATPLRRAVKLGHATGAIFGLFETTLKAMRLQHFAPNAPTYSLSPFVEERAWPEFFDQPEADELKTLAIGLGLKRPARALIQELGAQGRGTVYSSGQTHGDLHDGNVLIRRGDAILIDFGSIRPGPLTYDPAVLEVSLVFKTDEKDSADFDEWKAFVDALYDPSRQTLNPPSPEVFPTSFAWLNRGVRELRHIMLGCDCDGREAAVVLAACMVRFARLPIEVKQPAPLVQVAKRKHAYALVVAERILESMLMGKPEAGNGHGTTS